MLCKMSRVSRTDRTKSAWFQGSTGVPDQSGADGNGVAVSVGVYVGVGGTGRRVGVRVTVGEAVMVADAVAEGVGVTDAVGVSDDVSVEVADAVGDQAGCEVDAAGEIWAALNAVGVAATIARLVGDTGMPALEVQAVRHNSASNHLVRMGSSAVVGFARMRDACTIMAQI